MRTTLRFTSVVAGVALLFLWAAVILWGMDWLSTSRAVSKRIAVQTTAAAPQAILPTPRAVAAAPQPAAPPSRPVADAAPPMAPAAAVSTPRPPAAVHVVVGPASTRGAAVSTTAHVDEEHTDRRHDDHRGGRGHGDGGGRHSEGSGGGRDR
ncbi:MAG TPA: hypothetical protein VE953_17705 [Terriglobales bacterium]|nr:hypothetical protein [Terriglobales bacterium]